MVLYKVADEVYCSDANSTAFKFPLIDAKLLERALLPCHPNPGSATVLFRLWCFMQNPKRQRDLHWVHTNTVPLCAWHMP